MRALAGRYSAPNCFLMIALVAERASRDSFEIFHHWRCQVDLFDGVGEVLTRLRAHVPVVALSNGNTDLLKAGIDHLFDAHYSAE